MINRGTFDIESALSRLINNLDLVENDTEIQFKCRIVNQYERKLQSAVNCILKDMNIQPKLSQDYSICKMFIHGSTKLRMRLRTSDVDVVLVVPNYLSRNQWFNLITQRLSEDSCIEDVVPIIEAFVPVIKFKYENIQFDMVIGRIDSTSIKSRLDFDNKENGVPCIYKNVDSKSIHALSSLHIITEILEKTAKSRKEFVKFIMFLKIWARRRQIDQYIFGFPSTIAWVIMSLNTYLHLMEMNKKNEKVNVYALFMHFFSLYKDWPWPKAVYINGKAGVEPECLQVPSKECHLFPVVSLVHPFKNTAFTVRQSTLQVIKDEIVRGDRIVNSISKKSSELADGYYKKWERLFQEFNVNAEYAHFLDVILVCPKDQFLKIQGLVSAKLREYAVQLEMISSIKLARIHTVNPRGSGKIESKKPHQSSWLIGLKLEDNKDYKETKKRTKIDITRATITFFQLLQEKAPYTNFYRMLTIKASRKKEIK